MAYKTVVIAQDERKIRLQAVKDKILNKTDKTRAILSVKSIEDALVDILNLLDIK